MRRPSASERWLSRYCCFAASGGKSRPHADVAAHSREVLSDAQSTGDLVYIGPFICVVEDIFVGVARTVVQPALAIEKEELLVFLILDV